MIRDFELTDAGEVSRLFARQGINYEEPDWSRMFGQVLVDNQGVIRIALLHRKTVESYAVVDRTQWATPGMKAEEFTRLDHVSCRDLHERGFTDQHSWIPPKSCRAFARRLMKRFGWVPSSGPENWLGLTRSV